MKGALSTPRKMMRVMDLLCELLESTSKGGPCTIATWKSRIVEEVVPLATVA